jgi:transposase-like protein
MMRRELPPAQIDMARVREELRLREVAAEEESRLAVALAAQAAAQQAALSPAGGWWRHGKGGKKIRRLAVMEAISVGCSTVQIMRASGVTRRLLHNAIVECRKNPTGPGPTDTVRDWPRILADAVERGISVADVSRENGVSDSAVRIQAERHGIRVGGEPLPRWSGAEEAYLREHYSTSPMADMERHLSRCDEAIYAKAKRMGLKRRHVPSTQQAETPSPNEVEK